MTEDNKIDFLNQILAGLQSDDDVSVFQALMKLNGLQEVNDAILHELAALAVEDENPEIRKDSQALLDKLNNQITNLEVSPLQIDSDNPQNGNHVIKKIVFENLNVISGEQQNQRTGYLCKKFKHRLGIKSIVCQPH